jgi:DNA-binding transcriptional LysR family regulator
VRFELDGIDAIAKLVAEGLGISVLPDWAVIGPVDPRLRKHPLPGPSPEREVGLLWLRGAVRAALAHEFHLIAQEHFKA